MHRPTPIRTVLVGMLLAAGPLAAQEEGLATARRLLRELGVVTATVPVPDPDRLVAIGREGAACAEPLRHRLAEAFDDLEDALLRQAYPDPLPDTGPDAGPGGEDPQIVRVRNTHRSPCSPFPSIRATWTARNLLELGPDPSPETLLRELESSIPVRQVAALLALERRGEAMRVLRETLHELVDGRHQSPPRALGPGGGLRGVTVGHPVAAGARLDVKLLAARRLCEIEPPAEHDSEALTLLLDEGAAGDRLVALRRMAVPGSVSRLLRYRVIRILVARRVGDDELIAAVLACLSMGIPPESEWPPDRKTLRRWIRSTTAEPEQKQMARDVLSWRGPTESNALPALEVLAADASRPRVARVAARVLEQHRSRGR